MDDETLMAYADGELGADDATQVAAVAATDPGIAARIEMFRRTRAVLAPHCVPDPVPDALADRIRATLAADRSTGPADPAKAPAPQVAHLVARRPVFWPAALAASLALAFGLWSGLQLGTTAPGDPAPGIAALTTPGLGTALVELASGERRTLPDGAEIAMVASFRDPEGTLCREFEVTGGAGDTLVSVACHDGAAWNVRFALAAPANTGGYAPASSIEALEVWIEVAGMGDPLTPGDEATALGSLPRR
jgi:anti-sigma factor RsiW